MFETIVHHILVLEVIAIGVGATVFAVSYAVFFDWRTTSAGKALMYFVMSLDAVIALSVSHLFLGRDFALDKVLGLIVYTSVVVTIWRLVVVLWHSWVKPGPPSAASIKPRTHPTPVQDNPQEKEEQQ